MNLSVDILQVEIEVSIFFFFYQKYAVQYATVAELVERADTRILTRSVTDV